MTEGQTKFHDVGSPAIFCGFSPGSRYCLFDMKRKVFTTATVVRFMEDSFSYVRMLTGTNPRNDPNLYLPDSMWVVHPGGELDAYLQAPHRPTTVLAPMHACMHGVSGHPSAPQNPIFAQNQTLQTQPNLSTAPGNDNGAGI